jgi:hypothetical protein
MALPQQDPGYGQKKELAKLGLAAKTIDGSSGRQPGRPTGRPVGATSRQATPQASPTAQQIQQDIPEHHVQAIKDIALATSALQSSQAWKQQFPDDPWVDLYATIAQSAHRYETVRTNHILPNFNIQE